MKDLIRGRFLEPDILRSKHEERDVVTISSPGLELVEGGANVDDMRECFDLSRPLACSRDPMGLEPCLPKFRQAPSSDNPMNRASVDGERFMIPEKIDWK